MKPSVPVLGLFMLAFAVRLPFALHPAPPKSDAADYLRLARSVSEGRGLVDESGRFTAFRPPLYPILLSPLSDSLVLLTLMQSLLSAASCVLLVGLGARLLNSTTMALVPGLLLALDPIHAAASGTLLSETLYEFLLLLTLFVLSNEASGLRLCLAGFCSGLCILTRSAGAPVLLVLLLYVSLRHPRRVRAAGLLGGAAVLAIIPWLVRNAIVMGAPVLTTQGGITLYSSYVPPSGKIFGVLVQDARVREAQQGGEVSADRSLTKAALELAVSRPRETLRLAVLKVAFFLVPIDWEVATPPGRIAPVYLFALPLALGAWLWRRGWIPLAAFLLAGATVFSAVVYGSPRLRLPYEPLIYVLAAGPAWEAARRPTLWLWASFCAVLWLAGDAPRQWVRAAAQVLGLW